MTQPLAFSVLGPLRVTVEGIALPLGGPKQRAVLAMLLLDANRVVSVDRLIDGVWGDEPHDRAASTLQVYVSNLRKLLGADRIATERPGYRIVVGDGELDLLRFEADIAAGHDHLAAGRNGQAEASFDRALAAWQGGALADLSAEPFAMAASVGLDERREATRDARVDAGLALGHHRELVADLEAAVAATPLRERRWAQLMTALYRSGRQADALAAYSTARTTLVEALGIDPGADLRRLESAVLAQDPALDWVAPTEPAGTDTTVRRASSDGSPALHLPNGTRLDLGDRSWTVGRSTDCDIVLATSDVSRRHAEIRPTPEGWVVSDLGSTNGVVVNGHDVLEYQLGDGDRIEIGRNELVFSSPPTPPTGEID